MGKHIHHFTSVSAYESMRNGDGYIEPWVSMTDGAQQKFMFNKNYKREYLTFDIVTGGTIKWANTYTMYRTISYSLNGGEWTSLTSTKTGVTIAVNAGDQIKFKGENAQYSDSNTRYAQFKGGTATFNLSGNIMSLVYGDNFYGNDTLTMERVFFRLFEGAKIISSKNLILPAMTMTDYCYNYMFYACSSMVDTPELPATTLAKSCYGNMFYGCTSLMTAPVLPATTLADSCYSSMFYNCNSLTSTPTLPATTLASNCYSSMFCHCINITTAPALPTTTLVSSCYLGMFSECSGLTNAPALQATTLTENCYMNMFRECTSLVTPPVLPATTLASSCYHAMFQGCTSLTTAPALPATTVFSNSYRMMFYGCTSLTTAPVLPATTLANNCYNQMFYGCTGLTTVPEISAITLVNYSYEYMFQGCSSLNYIKAMFTTTPTDVYTKQWVDGVAATGTFVKNSAAQWDVTGINGIPSGWTVETASE